MDLILVIILKLIIKFNRCSLQIIKSLEIAMSRYSDFQEDNEEKDLSVLNEEQQEQNLVCVKNLLPIANPLMNKIQYHPYQPKNYYPALMSSLPPILNNHQYHIDKNNMASIDESLFTHQQLKKNVAKCLLKNHKIQTLNTQLLTLKQFYANKFLVYQKFNNASSNYFATFLLKLNSVNQKETQKLGKTAFLIRNTKTPLITQRCRTERYSACKPTVEFNSNFQSGNLFRVYQKEYNQYDLILQNDINTKGNNQWFFFSVRNVPKGANLKFNIVNMSKQYSLFEYGMKPAIFSMVKFQKRQVGWVRDGTKVTYKRSNQLQKQSSRQPYYTLSFQYKFIYEGDIVYFSYTTPYTFSNLTNFMSNQLADRSHSKKVKVRSLGQTLGGNEVTFFEFTNSESRITKKSIWVLGRQHSGEVTSSFMVEGMIQFLLSDQPEAQYLMNHFVIKVVPMVNIDGVVHGNTRAELSGCDSNRKWLDPHKIYQPIIYNIKKLIQKDNIEMILDLHSHSRKLGTFFYTNSSLHDANNIKVLPMMVCKNDQRFDYRSNRFKGGNDQTARKVFYDILKKPYIYTIQSSFYGYQKEGDFRITQYQPNDYREMGITVLKTFVELSKKKLTNIRDLRTLICDKAQLEEEDNLWDRMNEADQIQSVGSDQNPSEDQFSKKQFEIIIEKPAKKVTKKKRKCSVKASQNKDQSKKPEIQLKPKQNDKDSYYKKYFSGRFSMNQKPTDRIFQLTDKPKIQSKAFSCQVDLPQRQILHKSSMNNIQTDRTKLREKIIENRELCVFGQKVEDQLTISGNAVGTQTQNQRNLFKNRNEVSIENQKMSKRIFHSNKKMTTVMLHNENNFLNKGDILHAALRMLNKR